MKGENLILVPTDFSKVAENAISHAATIAKKIGAEIELLHVVSKQSEVDAARVKVEEAARKVSESGVDAEGIVRVGNIFEDIGHVAAEKNARLIIMGTHGVKGLQQRLTGSFALKVITNSNVPFIVVQEKSARHHYEDVIMPLDLSRETKHKLSVTAGLAKYFGSRVHMFVQENQDDKNLLLNLSFAKNYLADNGIPYEVKMADGKGSFVKQLLKYADEVEADLIAIVNSDQNDFDLFAGGDEQAILTNESQIPVLCVNPAKVTKPGAVLGS